MADAYRERKRLSHKSYIVCFDVTPLVVKAVKCSVSESEFEDTFESIVASCGEMTFFKRYAPLDICFTLDNRSPRAKRQTQIRRILESKSAITRLSDVCCSNNVSSATTDATTAREDSFVFDASLARDDTVASIENNSQTTRRALRISDLIGTIENILKRIGNVQSRNLLFDYNEGEGEIKAIRWLTERRCNVPNDCIRVLMSRDNDVFVYALSYRSRVRCEFVIYHEPSDSLLRCWDRFLMRFNDTCWVLVLWIAICFGNDYVYGIVEKTSDTMEHYFDRIVTAFERNQHLFESWTDDLFKTDVVRAVLAFANVIVWLQQILSFKGKPLTKRVVRSDVEREIASFLGADGQRNRQTIKSANSKRLDVLVEYRTYAENCASNYTRVNNERCGSRRDANCDNDNKEANATTTGLSNNCNERNERDNWRSLDRNVNDNDDVYGSDRNELSTNRDTLAQDRSFASTTDDWADANFWCRRHLWNFLYCMELPLKFSSNETFDLMPSKLVNVGIPMPKLHRRVFVRLHPFTIVKLVVNAFYANEQYSSKRYCDQNATRI